MEINIGGQYGEATADKKFWPLQKKINNSFEQNLNEKYFKSIKEFYIAFRVSGKIQDFGSEGPELMKYLRKRNVITIDLTFPETSWKGVEENVVHANILEGVAECIRLMTERAIKEKEVLDLEGFQTDVKKALDECRLPA